MDKSLKDELEELSDECRSCNHFDAMTGDCEINYNCHIAEAEREEEKHMSDEDKNVGTLKIVAISDVMQMAESAVRSGYTVTIKPVYEAYWDSKLDHYEIIFAETKKG